MIVTVAAVINVGIATEYLTDVISKKTPNLPNKAATAVAHFDLSSQ